MATAVFPYVGRTLILDAINVFLASGTHQFGLYITNNTPVDTDTLSVYTAIEATFPGYSRIAAAAIGSSSLDGNNNAKVAFNGTTWTCTGATSQTVYGWFLADIPGGTLLAACLLDTPVTVTNPGDTVVITINDYSGDMTPPF